MTVFRSTNGVGFPSCNRAIQRLPRNIKDPQGYYREIGVDPGATQAELRKALRSLYRKYHTDGTDPDPDKFNRIRNIGMVLLDPKERDKYNRTPAGERVLDAVYIQELIDAGLEGVMSEWLNSREMKPRPSFLFDFLSDGQFVDDATLANEWYHHLVEVAPAVGFTAVIKVFIHEGDDPFWDDYSNILMIPRHWIPSAAVAFALMRTFVRRVS